MLFHSTKFFGSSKCGRHGGGPTAAGRDLALKNTTIWRSGQPGKSLAVLASSRRTHRWEGHVCSGVLWHEQLVWAGSVLQYHVGFLDFATTEGPRLLFAFSCSTSSSHPLTDDCVLFQWHVFLVLGNFSSFFSYVNYRRQVQVHTRSSVGRGGRLD